MRCPSGCGERRASGQAPQKSLVTDGDADPRFADKPIKAERVGSRRRTSVATRMAPEVVARNRSPMSGFMHHTRL